MSLISTDTESIENFLDNLEKKINKDNEHEILNDDKKIKQLFKSISDQYKIPDTINHPFFSKSSYTIEPLDVFSSTMSYSDTQPPVTHCSESQKNIFYESDPFVYLGESTANIIYSKSASKKHLFIPVSN